MKLEFLGASKFIEFLFKFKSITDRKTFHKRVIYLCRACMFVCNTSIVEQLLTKLSIESSKYERMVQLNFQHVLTVKVTRNSSHFKLNT
jgi:Zn-finger protein